MGPTKHNMKGTETKYHKRPLILKTVTQVNLRGPKFQKKFKINHLATSILVRGIGKVNLRES